MENDLLLFYLIAVYVVSDVSLCYQKQPRDFCCISVEAKKVNIRAVTVNLLTFLQSHNSDTMEQLLVWLWIRSFPATQQSWQARLLSRAQASFFLGEVSPVRL